MNSILLDFHHVHCSDCKARQQNEIQRCFEKVVRKDDGPRWAFEIGRFERWVNVVWIG